MESPIVSAAEMRAAEEAAFARGVEVEALMDQAGSGVARAVRQFFRARERALFTRGKATTAATRSWRLNFCSAQVGASSCGFHFPKANAVS